MRRSLSIVCALTGSLVGLSILACGPNVIIDPIPDIPEIVEYDTVRIDYGKDDNQPETLEQALVGAKSELAQFTGGIISTTNKTLFDVMNQVENIAQETPTDFDNDAGFWVWEVNAPRREVSLRFSIQRLEDDEVPAEISPRPLSAIAYTFEYGRTRADRDVIYEGHYYKFDERADTTDRQQGAGLLRLNFSALHKYDETSPQGQMLVAFRSRNGIRQTNVALYRLQGPSDAEPFSALYAYTQLPEGQGRFKFFGRQDLFGKDSALELLGVDAAWNARREGRVAARVTGGTLQINEVLVDQCWDESAIARYQLSSPTSDGDGGGVIDCADELEALELEAPVYNRPDEERDPNIPGAHPDE